MHYYYVCTHYAYAFMLIHANPFFAIKMFQDVAVNLHFMSAIHHKQTESKAINLPVAIYSLSLFEKVRIVLQPKRLRVVR